MNARYPGDMSDAEWAVIVPFVPSEKFGGRPCEVVIREVVNAIFHQASSGCRRRMLPREFAAYSTVRNCFCPWRNDGTLASMNLALVQAAWKPEGKEPCPGAGVIDSQSVKTTESGGVCGYDAGKGIKGRKRHIVTDTNGFMVVLVVHGAGIQDRDGAVFTLQSIRRFHPFLRHISADDGYAGDKLDNAPRGKGGWTIEVIRRCDDQKGFKVLPRRWVVERIFAWLGRCRGRAGKGSGEISPGFQRMDHHRPYPHPHAKARKALL